jgi:GNAT superfamily N-acetyltransferase
VGEGTRDIQPIRDGDVSQVVRIWYRSGKSVYSFLPAWRELTLNQAHTIFREHILPYCEIWIGIHDDKIESFLAMKGSYIDRLYVNPASQRQGWGTLLLNHAKQLSPQGLELHTHQQNHGARAFYEHHGFVAVKFGLSPPPESVPDVEYHWRP